MKRLRLVISDEAISDLIDLWTYIAEDSPERADQFVDQIHEKCQTLTETPMMGRVRPELLPGMRSFPIGRYLIFYRIVEETLQVASKLSTRSAALWKFASARRVWRSSPRSASFTIRPCCSRSMPAEVRKSGHARAWSRFRTSRVRKSGHARAWSRFRGSPAPIRKRCCVGRGFFFLKARGGAGAAGASADRLIAKLVGRRYPTCMSEPARRLLDQAMQLPTRDRAALAVELLASLEGEPDLDAETAWAVEIERRVRRVESGEARFEDWACVRDELRPRR